MPDPISATGAQRNPTRFGALGMGARQFTGLWTQRSPYRDAATAYLVGKFYSGSRFDSIIDGANREISQRLTDIRRPGSSVYNSQTFPAIQSFYPWKYIQNGSEVLRVMADTAANVYDATGPSTKLNIWNKNAGSGATRFLGVNTELFFNDGIEPKKVVESALTWKANTLFDGAATSDATLGDFIIDPNGNIQQAVGGFTVLVASTTTGSVTTPAVSIKGNVLTLTLDTAQLADPTGVPTGTGQVTGGNLSAGTHFARVAGVDANGNTTEAGTESAAVTTTGATGQIAWVWPAIAGAASYRIYPAKTTGAEDTYFTSNTNSFTQTVDVSNVSGVPPTSNTTSTTVPDNLMQMVGVQLQLSGFTDATFLNGQTITILSVLQNGNTGGTYSNQITAAFTHADYTAATDTGVATSGSGITGGAQPAWATTLWAVTQDGGAQWINRSNQIQNWGIATPATAPAIFQTLAPVTYPTWQANTTYWPSGCVVQLISGVYYLFQLTTSGTTGTAVPTWVTAAIGDTTTDGTAVWTYVGLATWAATTAYAKGAFVTFSTSTATTGLTGLADDTATAWVYKAQNAGTSAATQAGWATGAGTVQQDGDIEWVCLGRVYRYSGVTLSGSTSVNVAFNPSQPLSSSAQIVDSNGYLQQVQDAPYVRPATPVYTGDPTYPVALANGIPGPYVSGATQPTWGVTNDVTVETLAGTNGTYGSGPGPYITYGNDGVSSKGSILWNGFINRFSVGSTVTATGYATVTLANGSWVVWSGLGDNAFGALGTFASSGGNQDSSGTVTCLESMWLNTGPYAAKSTAATYYGYSFGNSVTGHVGTSSSKSAATTTAAGYYANQQGFGSADPQVDTIWLWATAEGESTLIYMDTIANPGGGVPWTYTRTMPDVSTNGGPELNALIAAPVADANDPPPANITAMTYYLQRPWGIVDNMVVYGGGPDTLVGSGLESFAPLDEIPFPSQPIALLPITVQNGGLLVFTTAGIWIILGTGTSSNPFYATPYYSSVGVLNYNAVTQFNTGIFCMESNGKVSQILPEYPFNPQTGYTEVGFPIGDQFQRVTTGGYDAALFDPATAYVSWNNQNTAECALYVADGAGHWFRMSLVSPPESGMMWHPIATLAGGSSAVQSVETAPGKPQLLIGPAASGPICFRDLSVNADWVGSATEGVYEGYDAYDVKGVNILCSTGQWAEVAHIATKCMPVGARPQVSVLLGEIAPSEQRPYAVLDLNQKSNDPPRNPRSVSAYSDRYVLAQNGVETTGDCILTRFDFGSQTVADELLDWQIFASIHDEREEAAAK